MMENWCPVAIVQKYAMLKCPPSKLPICAAFIIYW